MLNSSAGLDNIQNAAKEVIANGGNNEIINHVLIEHDAESIEVNSLFIDSVKNREELSYKLIKQLEKIAIDLDFKASYVYLNEDDLALEIFKKLDYQILSNEDEILIKKEFRSLI